ncbi:MAG: cobyrinic acid a,c-diamide synthase [Marinosulfonomonas sp.]|nr:MAG: cobyrinic acid a,c-diamide synthase [Marinosulfonomonas sp.]
MNNGLIIAAPTSGSGKTTITLGILRALKRAGQNVRGAKSGPDYIDPRFHEAACGAPCVNLDAWAMSPGRISSLASGDGLLIIEGAMGLFDGAPPDGKGATADLSRMLNLPVILVIDAAKMAQSVAPLVAGFANHDTEVPISGLILNNVGSARHEMMLRRALLPLGIPVLGAVFRQTGIEHPSRHLGLVQAGERSDLGNYLDAVADTISATIDLDALIRIAAPIASATPSHRFPPPAQRISIASDAAFAFAYPHLLDDWRAAGAELSYFSPLNDASPGPADLIFLPGGYPELHAETLASATNFRNGMAKAALTTQIYGECGGYMVLGDALTDANGKTHPMLGLLALETSFAKRKLHLGYRNLTPLAGPFHGALKGHEFHYATTLRAEGPTLFKSADAEGNILPDMGLRHGRVCGSFAHVIDRAV